MWGQRAAGQELAGEKEAGGWLELQPCSTRIVARAVLSQHVTALAAPLPQRDGCPKIINLGSARTDLFYERKKYGFKRR